MLEVPLHDFGNGQSGSNCHSPHKFHFVQKCKANLLVDGHLSLAVQLELELNIRVSLRLALNRLDFALVFIKLLIHNVIVLAVVEEHVKNIFRHGEDGDFGLSRAEGLAQLCGHRADVVRVMRFVFGEGCRVGKTPILLDNLVQVANSDFARLLFSTALKVTQRA